MGCGKSKSIFRIQAEQQIQQDIQNKEKQIKEEFQKTCYDIIQKQSNERKLAIYNCKCIQKDHSSLQNYEKKIDYKDYNSTQDLGIDNCYRYVMRNYNCDYVIQNNYHVNHIIGLLINEFQNNEIFLRNMNWEHFEIFRQIIRQYFRDEIIKNLKEEKQIKTTWLVECIVCKEQRKCEQNMVLFRCQCKYKNVCFDCSVDLNKCIYNCK